MNVVMRTMLRSVAALTISAAAFSAALPHPVHAEPMLSVTIDQSAHQTSSINKNDRQYVPAVFFQKMGATVLWNDSSQTVTLTNGSRQVMFPSGGTQVIHRPGRTYIPLRYAAESLGMSVDYNAKTESVSIQTHPAALSTLAASTATKISKDDFYWLAQITEAEAGGEPYEGKVAVAAVILNRVNDPEWPNSIQDVIFQIVKVNGTKYYQFSPVLDGRIYKVTPDEETNRAVKDALNGTDPTDGATVFYNPKKTTNKWVRERPVSTTIGNHIFSY